MGSSFIHLIRTDSNEFFLMDAWDKCSSLVHWEEPEESGGEGGGSRDRDGEYL